MFFVCDLHSESMHLAHFSCLKVWVLRIWDGGIFQSYIFAVSPSAVLRENVVP